MTPLEITIINFNNAVGMCIDITVVIGLPILLSMPVIYLLYGDSELPKQHQQQGGVSE